MIILASASSARQNMLRAAGVSHIVTVSNLDEAAAKTAIRHLDAADQSVYLAHLKAQAVSKSHPRNVVIAADQILELAGNVFDKPRSLDEAARHLTALQGKTHSLHSAAVVTIGNETKFKVVQTVKLSMRKLNPQQISNHIMQSGPDILHSVGCYQIENRGVQLFDHIEGDYFAILGLPLVPLLRYLRESSHIPS